MEIVNDYVTRALIADNRGGLNIDKVLRDKLKDKYVRLKQAGDGQKSSPPVSSIDPFKREMVELKYHCRAPKQELGQSAVSKGKKKGSKRKRAVIKRYKSSILSKAELEDLQACWEVYWAQCTRQSSISRNAVMQRIRRGFVFTGSRIEVLSSTCKHDVGTIGTVLKETRGTFIIQSEVAATGKGNATDKSPLKYSIKMIPKHGRVFALHFPNTDFRDGKPAVTSEKKIKKIVLHGSDFVVLSDVSKNVNKNRKKKVVTLTSGSTYSMRKI